MSQTGVMKEQLRRLFERTLDALAIAPALHRVLRLEGDTLAIGGERVDLTAVERLAVVALGKAANSMAAAALDVVAPRNVDGLLISAASPAGKLAGFDSSVGGHPYPDEHSLRAAERALDLAARLSANDLVLYLLSGGGSAVCEMPVAAEISLEDCRNLYRLLVECGAPIHDMNVVRKHLSAIKGGRLAVRAHPARQVTLYVSDVPDGEESSIASGPTMPDESTVAECRDILRRFDLHRRLPRSIGRLLDGHHIAETPKPGDERFARSSWHSVLDNHDGVAALRDGAAALGWIVEIDRSVDDGPLERASDHLLGRLRVLKTANPRRIVAIVSGGELSWPVTGDGLGGRNQAFVLDCAGKIAGENIAVLSSGTDGIDGNSPAAGAVADGETIARARRIGHEAAGFQRRSDAFRYFDALDDALVIGPTGNNVRDLRLLVAY